MTNWLPSALDKTKPAYVALADMIESAIASGELGSEARLPSVRELACDLGLASATVLRGYGEARRRGLIGGYVGRGSFVLPSPDTRAQSGAQFSRRGRIAPDIFDLRSNVVPAPEEWATDKGLQSLLPPPRRQRALLGGAYTLSQSIEPWTMREAGERWARRCGVTASADHILVAAGGQHAIAAALCSIAAPEALLAVPMMTNSGVLTASRILGVRIIPVRMDEDGPDPNHLDYLCRKRCLTALYCAPAGGNPIPTQMPFERRAAIAQIADRYGLWIIEDDAPGPLVDRTLQPFAALIPARTLWLGSVAQSLGFGFRLAFTRVPSQLEHSMQEALRALAWAGATPGALLAAQALEDGRVDSVFAARNIAISKRHHRVARILGQDRCIITPGIPYIWFKTPPGWRTERLHSALESSGVAVAPASQFAADLSRAFRGMRISAGAFLTLEEYDRALMRIADTCAHPGRFRHLTKTSV